MRALLHDDCSTELTAGALNNVLSVSVELESQVYIPVTLHTTAGLSFTGLCRLIKDFEREARVDNMSATDLATRKKALVQELNSFITTKKEFTQMQAAKQELIGAGGTPTKGGAGLQQKSKDGASSCVSPYYVSAGL